MNGLTNTRVRGRTWNCSAGKSAYPYTDGVPEATNRGKKMFGTERMLAALSAEPDASPEKTLANVSDAVKAFVKEAEQFDDLTMMCLEYRG